MLFLKSVFNDRHRDTLHPSKQTRGGREVVMTAQLNCILPPINYRR